MRTAGGGTSENYRLLPQDSKVALDGAVAKTLQMVDAAGNRRDDPAGRPSYTFSDAETEAVALLKSGRYSEAIPLLTEWRDKSPYEVVAWMLLGSAYAGIGNPTEAEECFTTCTRLRPQFAFSYFQRGLARLRAAKVSRRHRRLWNAYASRGTERPSACESRSWLNMRSGTTRLPKTT